MNGEPGTVALYGWMLVTLGLLKSWPASACNNPVFAEIVPPHLRNMIYAFDRCFEGAIAACAAPLVGVLAEAVFGFKVSHRYDTDTARMSRVRGGWDRGGGPEASRDHDLEGKKLCTLLVGV